MHPQAYSGESACLRAALMWLVSSFVDMHVPRMGAIVRPHDNSAARCIVQILRVVRGPVHQTSSIYACISPYHPCTVKHYSWTWSISHAERTFVCPLCDLLRRVHDTPKRELTGPETLQMPFPCHQPASSTANVSLHIVSPYIWWATDPGTFHSILPPAAILHSRLFQDLLESFSGRCAAAERKEPAASESTGSDFCAHCCPIFSTAAGASKAPPRAPGASAVSPPCTHQCLSTAGGGVCVAAPPPAHAAIALPVLADAFAAWLAFVCANPTDVEPAAAVGAAEACFPAPAPLRRPRLLSTPTLQAVLAVADVVNDVHTVQAAARMLGAALFLSPAPPPAADVEVCPLLWDRCPHLHVPHAPPEEDAGCSQPRD